MAILTVLDTPRDLGRAAAERITTLCEESIAHKGSVMIALTGGTTPVGAYRALADPGEAWRHHIAWGQVHVFWSDERAVPPSDPDSNFKMAAAALLSRVPIPSGQIHRMRGELPPEDAARAYEQELIDGFELAARYDPTFDVLLLGLGADAHVASIFPGSPVIAETERRVAAVPGPKPGTFRITFTPPALLGAQHIVLIVSGAEKASAVAAAMEGPLDEARWPAQILRRAGERVEWFVDREAARALAQGG